jgi:type IV secretion system protein VirB4
VFFEAERREALGYPDSAFPDPASWLVDKSGRPRSKGARPFREPLSPDPRRGWPPPDVPRPAPSAFVKRDGEERGARLAGALAAFVARTDRAADLLAGFMPEIRALDDGETLTFLHGTVSDRQHAVAVPDTRSIWTRSSLTRPLAGGLEPMLGDLHLRTLTVLAFRGSASPACSTRSITRDFGYRWVTRFVALDRTEATRALTRLRRQWFNSASP